MSLYPSRLAFHILNLADKHGVTLIPAYIPFHVNVAADYLSQERLFAVWYLLPHIGNTVFQLWHQPKVDLLASSFINQCQNYYTFDHPVLLGS